MSSFTADPSDVVVLTERGLAWLRDRLDATLDELAELVERISRHDHTEEDLETKHRLVTHVEDLTRALAHAVTVDQIEEDPSIVELGDEVDVAFPDGSTETYVLVHPLEAPMDDRSISVESPLSRALLGRHIGDRVTVTAPAGVYSCVISDRRRAS
jgi:transcription elongation factor GreA